MTVRLQGIVRHYLGRAAETKPRPGVQQPDQVTPAATDLLPGSTFMETDTGQRWVWNGDDWTQAAPSAVLDCLLAEVRGIAAELRKIRFCLETELDQVLQDPEE